ncbi:MAG: TerC/Alx family metal homeostasis membrane protein [Myxococcota bacterium]
MMGAPPWLWEVFGVGLLVMLAIDIFAHRGGHTDSRRAAIAWSVVWIAVGLGFGGVVWAYFGFDRAQAYLAAYLIEKSLSVDNLFVFLLIFNSLRIPQSGQRKVLSWGIFGALVFRLLFVVAGAAALERFHWVAYLFGALLLFAAYRAFRDDPNQSDESAVVRWMLRRFRVSDRTNGREFWVLEKGRVRPTRLLIAVAALELTDVVFAIDSVPAAFSVARDPFIVYTSNAFAILGLRSLYIVLANALSGFTYLHYGLAGVLGFAGLKMMLADFVHVPASVSVLVIVLIFAASIVPSLVNGGKKEGA